MKLNLINLKNNGKIKILLYGLIVSFVILMITSRSSFLYPFNNWGDANAFFTMGKGLFNGKIIFKDLFEQKGPMLYLIYGIGYVISNKSFLGIFILECISSTVLSYIIYKIINLYLDKKYFYIILPIFLSLIYSMNAFACGGSCEEFCLPFIAYTIYRTLIFAKEKTIDNKKIYFVGFFAGIIFLMKYIMLGTSFAFCVYVFICFLIKKEYKKALAFPFVFLLGMLTPMVPWIIYFLINHALYDLVNSYILINLFAYGLSNVSIISRLFNCAYFFARNLFGTDPLIFVAFLGIALFILNKNKISLNEKIAVICLIFFSVLFTYIAGSYLSYYVLPMSLFIVFTVIGICLLIKNSIKIDGIIAIIVIILSVIVAYCLTPNSYLMGLSKSDMPQYQFAEIINKKEHATILNYGALDMGFYTVTGIVPNTKYFEKLNFVYEKYPENVDSLNKYIENRLVDFVVYVKGSKLNFPVTAYLEENYELLMEYSHSTDKDYTYYLYELKQN